MNSTEADQEIRDTFPSELTKEGVIRYIKAHRQQMDSTLQMVKATKGRVLHTANDQFLDKNEVIAQITLSQRALEESIMRLGMALKYTGEPDPYPESKNPASTVVAPTADGLTM